jgi:hypothetical protein
MESSLVFRESIVQVQKVAVEVCEVIGFLLCRKAELF